MRITRSIMRWGGTLALLALLAVGSAGQAAARSGSGPARVAVVVQAQPNGQVARGGLLTYTISAVNQGDSPAQNVRVTLPLDASKLKLVDVRFEQQGSWVRALNADSVLIETPWLASGDARATAVVRLQLLDNVANGATLGTRVDYTYGTQNSNQGGSGRSNLALVTVGNSDVSAATYPLTAAATSGDERRWSFASDVFAPNEPVTVWYHTPTGVDVETEAKSGNVVVPASSTDTEDNGGAFVSADEAGRVQFSFRPRGLPSGSYIMVARGAWTGFEATGTFIVQ